MAREVRWHLTDVQTHTNCNPCCTCAPGVYNNVLGKFFLSESHMYEMQNCYIFAVLPVCVKLAIAS